MCTDFDSFGGDVASVDRVDGDAVERELEWSRVVALSACRKRRGTYQRRSGLFPGSQVRSAALAQPHHVADHDGLRQ